MNKFFHLGDAAVALGNFSGREEILSSGPGGMHLDEDLNADFLFDASVLRVV